MTCTPFDLSARMTLLDAVFPARTVVVGGDAVVAVRECGPRPLAGAGVPTARERANLPLVCLHGIGSGAASWLDMAQCLAPHTRVIAWDAPGYGASSALPALAPRAADYALRWGQLLDALEINRCVLVGHSLGALVAASAAQQLPERIAALVLISPAQGYGAPGRESERARVHDERMASLAKLGIAGMAAQRSARLVSDQASSLARAWVRWIMAGLNGPGYRQAIELLCGGDLLADLPPPAALPVTVACGTRDVITLPGECAEVARRCGVALQRIDDAGHACYVEQPEATAALLAQVLGDTV